MAKLTLAQVQKRIKAKTSIRWEAGETSVSHLALVAKPGMAFFGIGAQAEELAASGGVE